MGSGDAEQEVAEVGDDFQFSAQRPDVVSQGCEFRYGSTFDRGDQDEADRPSRNVISRW